VKDIKPGVLSKIFILAERNPNEIKDDDMKKLCVACKGLQDSILDFASHKPVKEQGKLKFGSLENSEQKFRTLIEKIISFK
jgi:myb proto-oncogene protein